MFVALLGLVAWFANADEPAESRDLLDTSTFDVFTTEIGSFEVTGGNPRRIWASTRNEGNLKKFPEQWQFRYDPLFVFGYSKETGELLFSRGEFGDLHVVQFPLVLDDRSARSRALIELRKRYPAEGERIVDGNILARSLIRLDLDLSEVVKRAFPDAVLMSTRWDFPAPEDYLSIQIGFTDSDEADKFVETLRGSLEVPVINYRYAFNLATTVQNVDSIRFDWFQDSQLKAALDGLRTTEKYVRRDDARELLKSDIARVSRQRYIENPELFESDFVDAIFEKLFDQRVVELKKFEEQFLTSTYNGEDLTAAKITKEINDRWEKDEMKDLWKARSQGSIEGLASSELSGERLKERLRERSYHVEIEGDPARLVPKSLTIHRLNTGVLDSQSEIFDLSVYVRSRNLQYRTGSIAIRNPTTVASTLPDLSGRLSTIEEVLSNPLETRILSINGIDKGEQLSVVSKDGSDEIPVVVANKVSLNKDPVAARIQHRVINSVAVVDVGREGQNWDHQHVRGRINNTINNWKGQGYFVWDIESVNSNTVRIVMVSFSADWASGIR